MTDLYEIFDFTDADLKENRKGRLSQSQRARMRQSGLIFLIASVSGFGLFLFFVLRFLQSLMNSENIVEVFGMAVFLFALLVGVIYNSLNIYTLWKAVSESDVFVIKGQM